MPVGAAINIEIACLQPSCSINKVAVSIPKFSTFLEVLLTFGTSTFMSLNAEKTKGVGKELSRLDLYHKMKL